MPDKRFTWLCLAALLAIVPASSAAAVRPWLSGWLGGSSYAMDDVNDLIGQINAEAAGTGLSMDDISKGFNYGASFGLDVGNNFSVGLGYDRLEGASDIGDASGTIELKVPANLVRVFGRYTFPSAGKANGFLEASLGRVNSSSKLELTATGLGSEHADLEGSDLAFEGGGGANVVLAPQLDLTASLGYRVAKVKEIEVNGERFTDFNGAPIGIDWSGVVFRLGLTVKLTK
jgi:hypothetical protein